MWQAATNRFLHHEAHEDQGSGSEVAAESFERSASWSSWCPFPEFIYWGLPALFGYGSRPRYALGVKTNRRYLFAAPCRVALEP